jgi:hypothetical protein
VAINCLFLSFIHINGERNTCCGRLNDIRTEMLLSRAWHACRGDTVRIAVDGCRGTRGDSHQLAASEVRCSPRMGATWNSRGRLCGGKRTETRTPRHVHRRSVDGRSPRSGFTRWRQRSRLRTIVVDHGQTHHAALFVSLRLAQQESQKRAR